MGLTPQTSLTFSPIGQKVKEKEVVFGIPEAEAPAFTFNTTKTTTPAMNVKPRAFEFKPVEEVTQPRFQFSGGEVISQGSLEEDPAVPTGRKLPFIGKYLFGEGPTTNMYSLYEPGSFQQDMVEKGVVGFFMEGFTKEMNPTQAEIGEKVYGRYNKAIEEGVEPDRALDIAVQDVINNTSGMAQNIRDLKNPEIELTDEEQEIFKWTNRFEDFFAVLDAPIFVGSTKVITRGGKVLPKYVDELTTGINKFFYDNPAQRTPEIEEFILEFTTTKNPSLGQFDRALDIIRGEGGDVGTLQKQFDDIARTVTSEPAKFLDDAKSIPDGIVDEVADPAAKDLSVLSRYLQTRYGETALTAKNADKVANAEKQVFNQVFGFAKEAREIFDKTGRIEGMVQTVPSWVPREARDLRVFEEVADMVQRGEIPQSHATREMMLYNSMVDEIAKKVGVKTESAGAIEPATAVVERMNNRLRKPGSVTNPVQKAAREARQPIGEEADKAFKESLEKEIFDADDALIQYDNFTQKLINPQAPKARKMIERLGLSPEKLEDISQFKGNVRDMYRNTEKVFGEQWSKVKEAVFDPLDKARGKMWDDQTNLANEAKSYIVDTLGITRKSKKSAAVMDYGELGLGTKGDDALYTRLVEEWGEKDAKDIRDAAVWFRDKYDRMLDEVNAVRSQIYPNNPEKQIPRRKDYFRHFSEMQTTDVTGLVNAFEEVSLNSLDPRVAGLKDMFRPKSSWQSFAQTRTGNKTRRDALGGFLDYLPQYAYAKNIDPHIGNILALADHLADATKNKPIVNNYIASLRQMADNLLGRANPADEFVQSVIPGGRATINVIDWFNKRAKVNAILGNASASISQVGNIPNSVASAKQHSIHGAVRTLGDIFNPNPAWRESEFIKSRYGQSVYNQFSVGMLEKGRDFAGWMLQALDEVGTKFSWNAHYEKALREGMKDPMRYADDMARKMNAGRGVGEVPLVQQSKVFQTVAPFQLEVANAWFVLGEFVGKKEFSKIATLMVASYLMNRAVEEVRGSGVTFDMGEALHDSFKIATSEDSLKDKGVKIGGRLSGEVLTNLPVVPYAVAALYPEEGTDNFLGLGVDVPPSAEFFGEGDPIRYGTSPLLLKALQDPLFKIAPPFGGTQIKKTLEGIGALAEGKVTDKDGNTLMVVEDGPATALQNILFGKWQPNIHNKEKLEAEMRSLVRENLMLAENGNTEQANANVQDLPDHVWEIYKSELGKEKMAIRSREKTAMMPTVRTLDALKEQGKDEEVQQILDAMTDEQYEMYGEIRKAQREESAEAEEKLTAQEMIQEALDYSYAFGTNPVQAFEIVFKNHEHIEDTVSGPGPFGAFNGVVRTRRMPFKGPDGSAAMKEELGAGHEGTELFLEHIIPLSLGGTNKPDNLMLYWADDHHASTPIENYLAKELRDQRLHYKDAQRIILEYRQSVQDGKAMSLDEVKALVADSVQ